MEPALRPGDLLLALRLPAWWPLRPGDLVVAPHPFEPERLMVKRVGWSEGDLVHLVGDNRARSTDSRTLGPFARRDVWGRVWWRYGPAERSGAVR